MPHFYKRYVDDTLTIMPDTKSATNFLQVLPHICHTSVKFTMETEVNGLLPFLGMQQVYYPNDRTMSTMPKPIIISLTKNQTIAPSQYLSLAIPHITLYDFYVKALEKLCQNYLNFGK